MAAKKPTKAKAETTTPPPPATTAQPLAVELVQIADLKPHPKNYRGHGKDQLEHIAHSIRKNGFYRNVVTAADGTILAGHGVVEACKTIGIDVVPIVRLPVAPTSAQALKVLAGDNEISNLGEVNDRLLSDILMEIKIDDVDYGLLGTGFDPEQLANLVYVTRPQSEIKDFDAAREWVGLPAYDSDDPTKSDELAITIVFANAADRERYVAETNLQVRCKRGGKKWSTLWPYQEKNDRSSLKFEAGGK